MPPVLMRVSCSVGVEGKTSVGQQSVSVYIYIRQSAFLNSTVRDEKITDPSPETTRTRWTDPPAKPSPGYPRRDPSRPTCQEQCTIRRGYIPNYIEETEK